MVVLVVVPVEGASAEAAGVLVAPEARRVIRSRLERVEVRFGKGIVVADARP